MYSHKQGFILGFHGCDREVRDRIVFEKGEILKDSDNSYDWLGSGCYFWENNYHRAYAWAEHLKANPPKDKKNLINEPSVLGAVIDLGNCLDLLNSQYLDYLKIGYNGLLEMEKKWDYQIPKNEAPLKNNPDLLLRYLDCAVIEYVIKLMKDKDNIEFDSVRGVFFEGDDLYPNAGFKEKNHIQISIRNHNCIKGYFIPREKNMSKRKV